MAGFFSKILYFSLSLLISGHILAAPAPAKGKDDKDAGAKPTYDVTGHARLSSNFIDRGLSMSNGSFAFNSSILINLGSQFKFGFWGSNISKLGAEDDNLWLKYIAEVFVDFQTNAKSIFYVHDDHYYKSDSRNGQRIGFKLDYGRFTGLFEFQNNYEGTKATGYYTQVKFNKKYTDKIGLELGAGYTLQYSSIYNSYFDVLATGYYNTFANSRFEAGVTVPSDTKQFDRRSKIGYFIAFNLLY